MSGEAVSPLINLFTPTLPPLQHEEARQGELARQAEEGAVQGAIRREPLVTTLGMGDQLLKVWGSTNMGELGLKGSVQKPWGGQGLIHDMGCRPLSPHNVLYCPPYFKQVLSGGSATSLRLRRSSLRRLLRAGKWVGRKRQQTEYHRLVHTVTHLLALPISFSHIDPLAINLVP